MDTKGKMIEIVNGPNKLSLEHSHYDEEADNSKRKHLRFECEDRRPILGVVIVGGFRKDMHDPVGNEWIFWATDGGAKFLIDYSTQTRKGRALIVEEFPDYGFPK